MTNLMVYGQDTAGGIMDPDVIEEEASEDLYRLGGLPEPEGLSASIGRSQIFNQTDSALVACFLGLAASLLHGML